MLRFFGLEWLWEQMGEGKEADELDTKIRKDELFKVVKNNEAFFIDKNEQEIYNKYPQIKEKTHVYSVDEYIDYHIDFKNIKLGNLEIDSADLISFIKESILDREEEHEDIFNSEDLEEKLGSIIDSLVSDYISIEIQSILEDVANNTNYKLNKSMLHMFLDDYIK